MMTKTDIQTVLDALTTVDSCVGLKNYFHDKPDGTDVRLDQVVDDAIAILQALAEPSEPYAIAYEYDGPFGMHQSFTYEHRNGKYPDRSFPVFKHPAPSKPEPSEPVAALDVTIDDENALALIRDFVVQEDGDFTPIRLLVSDGHSGYGLYIAAAEYQDEGAILLQAMNPTHPASKPAPLPELTDDEIVVLYAEQPQCDADMAEFARSVLAAAREKCK